VKVKVKVLAKYFLCGVAPLRENISLRRCAIKLKDLLRLRGSARKQFFALLREKK
jgi:hypothetical protein